MKIEIERKVATKAVIDIDLPYYYKHDLMMDDVDVVIYGKIEEHKRTTIKVSRSYYTDERAAFELCSEQRNASTLSCYMEDAYSSSEKEYLKIKAELIAAANNA